MATVLITGANRGIGIELVRIFSENDWTVLACCRKPEEAQALADLASKSSQIEILPLDVSDATSATNLAEMLKDKTVDFLVNNAGIMGGERQGATDMDFDAWGEAFRINTMAPLRMVQVLLTNLRRSTSPKIATISSQMGALNRESAGAYAYRSSKAAVNKVMQTLACEMAMDGFIITLFHPGWVQTDMGGSQADITAVESATGLFNKMAALTADDNGRFYKWNGEEHPW